MKTIGFIGTGGIAKAHAAAYEAMRDRAQVAALYDADETNLAEMQARFPEAKVFTDWQTLLSSDVDAVDICLPPSQHKIAIVDAANAGKHILCEKPLCSSWDETQAISQAVEENKVTLMCAHSQLFDPAVQRAQKYLRDGYIGRPRMIRATSCFSNHCPSSGSLDAIGGCLTDNGYSACSLLHYLAGSSPVEVTAILDHHSANPLEGEDGAEVMVRFQNGVRGSAFASSAYELPFGHWQFHLIGERGQMYGKGNVMYCRLSGWQSSACVELPPHDSFQAEINHFLDCLETGKHPLHPYDDALEALRIVLGAYESAKTKQTIAFKAK